MLIANNLTKRYGQLQVLKGVSMRVNHGEMVAITGSSGAGKSTLLHLLGTLDRPDTGTILLDGNPLHEMKANALAKLRNRHLGFVFQFHHLLPEFTAMENVCIPAFLAGKSNAEAAKQAGALLERVGLSHRLDHKPQQLSGGEQQRVAIARALINQPAFILADEPTGNLDSDNALQLHRLFADLCRERNQGFVIVTHNEELASLCHRRIVMKDGRVLIGGQ